MNEALRDRLGVSVDEIAEFCRKWEIVEFSLFGSALREDFRPDSDVDVLVEFTPEADWTLLDHLRMEQELKSLLSRDVDLVSKRAIERSKNWIRREGILTTAQPVYVSR